MIPTMHIYRVLSLSVLLFSGNAFAQSEPELSWQFGMLGHNLGQAGILIADIDRDGKNEIVSSGRYGGDYWNAAEFFSVLSYDSEQGHYVTKFISNVLQARISTMQLYDFDENGSTELYLGLDNGTIVVYDLRTLAQISTITIANRERDHSFDSPNVVHEIAFGDVINDQSKYLVAVSGDTTYVLDDQYQEALKIPFGAPHLRIGNIDNDAANEIIYSNGTIVEVADGDIEKEHQFFTANPTTQVALANLDGDGTLDVIYSSKDTLYAFNFKAKQLIWSNPWESDYQYNQYITGLWLYDYDGDQVKDVIIGNQSWDAIYGYNGRSGTKEWILKDNNGDGVENLAIADLDNDQRSEIIWSSGAGCTCPDYFFVYDLKTKTKEWQSKDFFGDFKAFDVGDVDNDGEKEIVIGAFGQYLKYYDHGFISVLDAKNKFLEWQNDEEIFNAHVDDFTSVKVGDIDNDGLNELLLGINYGYSSSQVYVFDDSYSVIKQYRIDGMDIILDIEIADVDLDGKNEVIITSGTNVAGSTNPEEWKNYLYVFDGETAEVEWRSPQLDIINSKIGSVKVGNIDDDEALEVVALQYESRRWETQLLIYDGITQELTSHFMSINAFDIADFDNDGTDDILVGLNTGEVGVLEKNTLELINTYDVGSGKINALELTDFNQDGMDEFVLSDNYKLYIYDPTHSVLKWQSDTLNIGVGRYNSLLVEDIDSDGITDILLNAGHALYNFEVVDYESLNIVTGFREKLVEKKTILYPNPFQNKLSIQTFSSSNYASYEIKLFNLQGVELYSARGIFRPQENLIDLSPESLGAGTYLYRLSINNDKLYSGLIIKAD